MPSGYELMKLEHFQASKLGYHFRNIELLTDALTHSTDNDKCEKFYRLQVLGNVVLKLVISEYVIQSSVVAADPGVLTQKQHGLINNYSGQTPVGVKLFGYVAQYNIHESVLKMSYGVWANSYFEVPYHKFLKAIFGAVFLDAGGSSVLGIEECMKLFLNLWKDFGVKEKKHGLDSCFPLHRKIREYWINMGMDSSFTRVAHVAEVYFGVKFINSDLVCQALIHKSFYDPIMNSGEYSNIYMPHYERLEFLGDSVLGLIITEFMYHKYPDSEASIVYERANDEVNAARLMEVAERLKIRKCRLVSKQDNVVFENYDDILEAVIGAIYVDSGEDVAREFILREFQLKETEVFTFESIGWKPQGEQEEVPIKFRRMLSEESVSKLTMEEWMNQLCAKAKPYSIKKKPRREPENGILYEIFYNYILPVFRRVGGACEEFFKFVKFVVKIIAFMFGAILLLIFLIVLLHKPE